MTTSGHFTAPSSSSSTASASASCPTRHLYGDEGSDTLGNIAAHVALRAADAAGARARAHRDARAGDSARRPRRAAAFGRMAEALGGQGFGDRPLGDDGHRARSRRSRRFPHGFPRDLIDGLRVAHRPRRRIGNEVGVRHADHRRARRRAHAHRARRSSTRRPTACSRSPRTRTSCRFRELYRICEIAYELAVEGLGVGRVIARPFVGAPGRFTRTAEPSRLRDAADGRDAARSAEGRGVAGRRDRQDRGSLRRPRHHARRATRRATTTGMDASLTAARHESTAGSIFANLVDFDTQYGHRNDVAGYAREPRAVRRAAADAAAASAPGRPAGDHRRSRQRPDDAEHGPLARARAAARRWAGGARGRRSRHARDLRRSRPDARRRSSACRPLAARHELPRRALADPEAPMPSLIREQLESARARDPGARRRRRAPTTRGRLRAEPEDDDPPGLPARSRSHHSLQGVPPPEAQDAGVLRADRRSLPHAPDPHARGLADRAHDRQGAAAARGADRGDRARPRPRPHAVRPRRRARARTTSCRAASTTTSRACASWTSSRTTAAG